jgi:hypothetical protein
MLRIKIRAATGAKNNTANPISTGFGLLAKALSTTEFNVFLDIRYQHKMEKSPIKLGTKNPNLLPSGSETTGSFLTGSLVKVAFRERSRVLKLS